MQLARIRVVRPLGDTARRCDRRRQLGARLDGYLLESEASGASSPAASFLDAGPTDDLTCILLDIQMPGRSGLDVLRVLAGWNVRPPPMILSGHAHWTGRGGDEIGSGGFHPEALCAAKHCFARCEPGGPRGTFKAQRRSPRDDAPGGRMTKRQRDILSGIVRGRSNKIIAWELQLSAAPSNPIAPTCSNASECEARRRRFGSRGRGDRRG